MKKLFKWLKHFFFPPSGTPLSLRVLPYAILGILSIDRLDRGDLRLGLH